MAPAAAAFYEPRITPNLYGLIDVREQLFYYDPVHRLQLRKL